MNKDDCQAAFIDNQFSVCEKKQNLEYFKNFQGSGVWLWKGNKTVHCSHLNTCFCHGCKAKKLDNRSSVKNVKKSRTTPTSSGFIKSTNFQQNANYLNYEYKVFPIEVVDGAIIELIFEYFDLEYHPSCAWDWIMVQDIGDNSILLPKTCGNKLPASLASKTNKIEVIFYSDYNITRRGFNIKVSTVLRLSSVKIKQG